MKVDTLISELQKQNHRITPIRKDVLSQITSSKEPISAADILKNIRTKHDSVNKTTVYRELEFLKAQKIIKEIEFGDRKKRYEVMGEIHHHHIVCVNCGVVEDTEVDIDLKKATENIKKRGYAVLDHSLEFFGICKSCQH